MGQVRCHNCGFLAVWKLPEQEFLEATDFYRKNGGLELIGADKRTCPPKCFVRKADIQHEVETDDAFDNLFRYDEAVKKHIQKERICNGFTPWIQGFHPKEHREMLLNAEMLEAQRRHANHSLYAAIATAIFTGLSVAIGAWITSNSANIGAEATIKAAQLQIEAQKELTKQEINKPMQPISITVQMPEPKTAKKLERK